MMWSPTLTSLIGNFSCITSINSISFLVRSKVVPDEDEFGDGDAYCRLRLLLPENGGEYGNLDVVVCNRSALMISRR